MPTKNRRELLLESEAQAESLFITFGRLLYENIQAGTIAYYFYPEDPALTLQAKRLVRDVVAQKISNRKEKRASTQVPQEAPEALGQRDEKQVLVPLSRRGQLEPYVKLNVLLRVAENKILDVQKDLNDCLSAGLLHTSGQRTAAYQAAVDEKIQKITLLMAEKREEIKRVMETKKKFFADNPEDTMWKAEKSFIEELGAQVGVTTRRVDDLIDEVVNLFKNINDVYEKDLEKARIDAGHREARMAASLPAKISPIEPQEQGSYLEEYSESEDLEEPYIETQKEEDLLAEEQKQDKAEGVDEKDQMDDYGLFETAKRKLESESSSDDDKLAVLHTLFRNAPKRAVPFLYELIREADIFLQRKLLSLLSQLDYPTMVDLYRRFINDEHSSLRLQGMMGLVKLGSEEATHVIVSAIRDNDPHVRRFIVNHLDHRAGGPQATAIARLAADSDEGVARVAIRKLGLMGDHFAFVTLVGQLESSNIKVCKETITALVAMTGTDQGYDYSAPVVERKKQARVWKALAKESYIKPRLLRDLKKEHLLDHKGEKKDIRSSDDKKRK
ncbi:MAG: HEAT repeat domain-containing protein [Candidatus Omnitrophica bacterium]|nr:HEAT repeat domain-containing protein [Candidatus Omnitrophota bacterium]